MSLPEFLLARIAEDEAVARATSDAGWSTYDPDEGTERMGRFGCIVTGGMHPTAWPADAAHIARHDPARVLAECEAKRLIVAEHEMTTIRPGHVDGYWWSAYCRRCTMDGEYADITKEPLEDPCPTLRFLALPYADHEDYREAWKP